jgi:seryl-tRNA synthetase
MLDIKWIRTHPDLLDDALMRRGDQPCASVIQKKDETYRHALQELEALRQEKKVLAQSYVQGDHEALRLKGEELKEALQRQESVCRDAKKDLDELLEGLPNILSEDVPVGVSEADNVVIRNSAPPPECTFDVQPHHIVGERYGLNLERGRLLSGTRFCVLQGDVALLERALINFMIDTHLTKGFELVSPPYLLRSPSIFGAGQLPKFREDLFQTTNDYWLLSTGEVPLINMLRESSIDAARLPLRYVAHTPCFRSEAGAAGKDTQGLIRLHQFSKVEMVSFTSLEASEEEHAFLLQQAESLLQALELPYRVMLLCSGDTGFASQKTYDLEVWFPSQKTYREIASLSNCGDFQARRMGARIVGTKQYLHTLNGSGLPLSRTLAAILENYQTKNKAVQIPQVLRKYMDNRTELKPVL